MRKCPIAILMCVVLAGCGKKDGKPESAATPSPAPASNLVAAVVSPGAAPEAASPTPAAAQPSATATPSPRKEPRSAVAATDFKGRLQEVEALENDTDFVNAIRLCEAMKADFTDIGQLKTLAETLRRLIEAKQSASRLGLAFAVQQLGSADSRMREAGERVLADAGETGAIFLRHAFRTKEESIATVAGLLLARMGDTNAIPLLTEKLIAAPRSPVGAAAAQGLVLMARHVDKAHLSACLDILRKDKDIAATNVIDILDAVFVRVCNRDENAFNEALGVPSGMDVLREYFDRALVSSNPDIAAWACDGLPEVLPLADGFRARYYTNAAFESCVLDRYEAQLRIDNNAFPLPDGRQTNISARWTAGLLVATGGDYYFDLRSTPRAQLWLDERPVDLTVALSPGWYRLKVEYAKPGPEDGSIWLVGANPSARLCTPPWPEQLAALARATADLGSTNPVVASAAAAALSAAGGVGRVFLAHAVHTDSGIRSQRAADALAEQALRIEPRRFPAFFRGAMAAGAEPMNPKFTVLCAAVWQVCTNDATRFNALVGDPDGYAKVKAHVEAALVSEDKALVARACRNGYPFAPDMEGLYARYYADPDYRELAVERRDSGMEIGKPNYPLPPDRQGRVSVRWTGRLLVEKSDEYRFWWDVRGQASVSVHGIGITGQTRLSLSAGPHLCSVEFRQADTNAESWIRFKWNDWNGRPLGPFGCSPWDSRLEALATSVQDLASGDAKRMEAAAAVVRDSAGVGFVYLRNGIRYGSAPEAAAAAALLGELRDKDAPPVLLARLKTETDTAARGSMRDALCRLAGEIAPKTVPELYQAALAPEAGEMNPYACILCAVAWRACGNDPKKFGDLTGDAGAYAKLDGHVKAALISRDGDAVTRACRDGYPFAPDMVGLHGRYYSDPDYRDLAAERCDAAVMVGKPNYPVPPDRQNRVSARWTGFLIVEKAAEYAFSQDVRGEASFSVDGIGVGWGSKMRLDPGRHPCAVAFRQSNTNADSWVRFYWEAPGIGMGGTPVGPFRCVPWDGRLKQLGAAVRDLASGDVNRARDARAAVRDSSVIGLIYIRNGIRHGTASEAAAAAAFLAELRDKDAPPVLLARLKTEKDAAAIVALTDALGLLVREIEPKTFPELYKDAFAEGAPAMNPYVSILCSALWRVCGGDAKKFGDLAGAADASAKLETHVKAALASSDPAVVAKACRNGYPIAPLLPGLRGRYFKDPTFLDLLVERQDSQIKVDNRQFPLPTNRQDNISAEWTGLLMIDQTGEYAFTLEARSWAALYVDGVAIGGKMTLTSGVHTIRGTYAQNQPGAESWVRLSWSGPGMPGNQWMSGVFRAAPWDAKLAELAKAPADLAASDPAKARAARNVLADSGGVGRVYLLNAVRHEAPAAAAAAAAILAEVRDKDVPPVLLARLKTEKDAAAIAALTDALVVQAPNIDPKMLPEIYRTGVAQGAEAMNPNVRILCAALIACGGSPEAFNKLVNDPNGHQWLQNHVLAALASASAETVRSACQYGFPFAPALQGFIGRYYRGQDFSDLAIERFDPQVNVPNRQYPFPDGRQDNISARWNGLLRIEKPGDYTFIVNASYGANAWIDDRHVAASAGGGEQKKDAVNLTAGLHRVRVDTWQSGGNNQVTLGWVPPGGNRDWIPSGLLMSPPSAAILAQIEKAVADLSAPKPETVGAAAEVLKRHGAVSLFFLRRALRSAQPSGVGAYVPLMVEMGDLSLADLLRELRKTQPPLAAGIDAALESLTAKPDRRYGSWFYAVMKGDKALEFAVSGKFLTKALRDVCGTNESRFNNEFAGDPQGAPTLKAYLDKLPKENKP